MILWFYKVVAESGDQCCKITWAVGLTQNLVPCHTILGWFWGAPCWVDLEKVLGVQRFVVALLESQGRLSACYPRLSTRLAKISLSLFFVLFSFCPAPHACCIAHGYQGWAKEVAWCLSREVVRVRAAPSPVWFRLESQHHVQESPNEGKTQLISAAPSFDPIIEGGR